MKPNNKKGKTTLVEYMAARCGHTVVRINNHEHTDIQEYTGAFCTDSNGSISFHDGLLVRALKEGYWVILDELNLAPSDVLGKSRERPAVFIAYYVIAAFVVLILF